MILIKKVKTDKLYCLKCNFLNKKKLENYMDHT